MSSSELSSCGSSVSIPSGAMTSAGTEYTDPTCDDSILHIPGPSYMKTYRYIKHLGGGGQGTCALYRRDHDHKLLVCKKTLDRFRREGLPLEVSILKDVLPDAACFPLFHQAAVFGPYTYTILEYCNAGDLDQVIKKYENKGLMLPESFIWHVFLGLAEALALIHHNFGDSAVSEDEFQPVLHRDIKPANVFLRWSSCSYPDVVLGDWGLAAVETDADFVHEDIGTYQWQAPELPAHSQKGDVWSMGAVIHACCHGYGPTGPEPATNDDDVWEQYVFGPRVPIDIDRRYSAGLQYWLLMTMKQNPAARISSSELMEYMAPQGMLYRQVLFAPLCSDCLPMILV